MAAYRPSLPYESPPLRRRVSGFGLALAVNLLLLFVLLGIGKFAPDVRKNSTAVIVDLLPESHSVSQQQRTKSVQHPNVEHRPVLKPPRIVLPQRPAPEKSPVLVEMSKEDLAASDIGNMPKAAAGSDGDSEEVGRGPHGEVLYAAEWARHPTDAELGGYLPADAPEGFGLIACKTIPDDRVDDCVELDQEPRGSHLASAVRQAAWQFRVRPPRKNGRAMVGEWVEIRIDYLHSRAD